MSLVYSSLVDPVPSLVRDRPVAGSFRECESGLLKGKRAPHRHTISLARVLGAASLSAGPGLHPEDTAVTELTFSCS